MKNESHCNNTQVSAVKQFKLDQWVIVALKLLNKRYENWLSLTTLTHY